MKGKLKQSFRIPRHLRHSTGVQANDADKGVDLQVVGEEKCFLRKDPFPHQVDGAFDHEEDQEVEYKLELLLEP